MERLPDPGATVKFELLPALDDQRGFCEALHRSNMSAYLAARNTVWAPDVYLESWKEFENLMILADGRAVGVLRLSTDDTALKSGALNNGALEVRDLQVEAGYRRKGVGTWVVQQTRLLAVRRGLGLIRLRVFEENPARALYARLGFRTDAIVAGKVHMSLEAAAG